jgi:hypothetical protein
LAGYSCWGRPSGFSFSLSGGIVAPNNSCNDRLSFRTLGALAGSPQIGSQNEKPGLVWAGRNWCDKPAKRFLALVTVRYRRDMSGARPAASGTCVSFRPAVGKRLTAVPTVCSALRRALSPASLRLTACPASMVARPTVVATA